MISTYRTGSSKSPNAQRAENAGRRTWSQLTKAERHGLTKDQAIRLNLNLGEWHHTSSFANRAEYFDPAIIAEILDDANLELLKEALTVNFFYDIDGQPKVSLEAIAEYRRVQNLADRAQADAAWTR